MAEQRSLWLVLAASSALRGDATILGAAANEIILRTASQRGVEIPFRTWLRAGLPVAVLSLILAAAALAWLV